MSLRLDMAPMDVSKQVPQSSVLILIWSRRLFMHEWTGRFHLPGVWKRWTWIGGVGGPCNTIGPWWWPYLLLLTSAQQLFPFFFFLSILTNSDSIISFLLHFKFAWRNYTIFSVHICSLLTLHFQSLVRHCSFVRKPCLRRFVVLPPKGGMNVVLCSLCGKDYWCHLIVYCPATKVVTLLMMWCSLCWKKHLRFLCPLFSHFLYDTEQLRLFKFWALVHYLNLV